MALIQVSAARSWLFAPLSILGGYIAMSGVVAVALLAESVLPAGVVSGEDGYAGSAWPLLAPLYYGVGLGLLIVVAGTVAAAALATSVLGRDRTFSVTGSRLAIGLVTFSAIALLDGGDLFELDTSVPLDSASGGLWLGFGAAAMAGLLQSRLVSKGTLRSQGEVA